MKKLMYLLVAGTLFIFTACNSGGGAATKLAVPTADEAAVEDVDVAPVEEVTDTAAEEVEVTEETTE